MQLSWLGKSSSSSSSSNGMPHYSTGRGGAGNMHTAGEERRMFSFDEELAVERKLDLIKVPSCASLEAIPSELTLITPK